MTTYTDKRYIPVIGFDVDGVSRISSTFAREASESMFETHEIVFSKDHFPNIFHGTPPWNEHGKYVSTNLFAVAAIKFMREVDVDPSVEPVWATTWQSFAHTYFGDIYGISEWPVAVEYDPKYNNSHCSPAWKSYQLADKFDGRPIIWIDDNPVDRDFESLVANRNPEDRHLTLFYKTNPVVGLMPADIDQIREWLELTKTPEGQQKLLEDFEKREAIAQAEDEKRKAASLARREAISDIRRDLALIFPGQEYFITAVTMLAGEFSLQPVTEDRVKKIMIQHSIVGNAAQVAETINKHIRQG